MNDLRDFVIKRINEIPRCDEARFMMTETQYLAERRTIDLSLPRISGKTRTLKDICKLFDNPLLFAINHSYAKEFGLGASNIFWHRESVSYRYRGLKEPPGHGLFDIILYDEVAIDWKDINYLIERNMLSKDVIILRLGTNF